MSRRVGNSHWRGSDDIPVMKSKRRKVPYKPSALRQGEECIECPWGQMPGCAEWNNCPVIKHRLGV